MAIPASPTNVVVSSITSTTATISWDQSVGTTGYNVYDKDDNVVTNLTGIESTSYDLINLLALTAYAYKVSAINNDGESDKVVVTFCTLKTPTENISLSNMQIGDYIPCRYTAQTSGIAGSFSELGTCEADEIPVSGTDTPDGKFNFVKVAKGTVVADRVVQTSVSWDTLNIAKYIEGGSKLFIDKLANPSVLPTGEGHGVAFSPDGVYMAVTQYLAPCINIYKRSNDTFTKLDNPSGGLPTHTGYSVAFSPNGVYMTVGHANGITIYKRDGDTFTKLPSPSGLPSGNANGISFSPDGVYLAVAHNNSPYITIHKRNGDTFTKLDDPSVLPGVEGYGVIFSPDGTYLAVNHWGSPHITIYKRNGDVFAKLDNPSQLPISYGRGVAFSPDGIYMAVASSTTVTIYKRDGDTFTNLPSLNPSSGSVRSVAFSPDGTYIAVGHDNSPYITIYKRDGDVFAKLDNLNELSNSGVRGIAFSSDGVYMAVAHNSSPYVTIYKLPNSSFPEQFIRSLSGGNSYLSATQTSSTTDASLGSFPPNNEYDQYIQLSTLDNKITAGDNNVWNYSGISSWVQETPITTIGSSSNRVYRGNTLLGFGRQASSTANATTGFRPVLIYDE